MELPLEDDGSVSPRPLEFAVPVISEILSRELLGLGRNAAQVVRRQSYSPVAIVQVYSYRTTRTCHAAQCDLPLRFSDGCHRQVQALVVRCCLGRFSRQVVSVGSMF